ncbi:MAG: hypothetical protein LBK73_08580 [Treponema sp.]|nr:hypothetical protein [Treponema sp.]
MDRRFKNNANAAMSAVVLRSLSDPAILDAMQPAAFPRLFAEDALNGAFSGGGDPRS